MKKNFDPRAVQSVSEQQAISELISQPTVTFFLSEYKKGEFLCSPLSETSYLHFVYQGKIAIYSIGADGSTVSLAEGNQRYLIGDMEFLGVPNESLYAEALTDVRCLSIDLEKDRSALLNDCVFLRFIAENLAQKMVFLNRIGSHTPSLEDRVCNYMRYHCPENTFRGLEKTAFRLHCSTRQLQRVMNRLEESGRVKKIGKGAYSLE